jgi:DNA-binding NarL/FixJ family response regulator
VLVVEDAPETQRWLATVVAEAFPNGSVLTSACVRESLEIVATQPVDIALIDLELPDGSGIEVIQECFRSCPLTRCVISTVYDDDDHLMPALSAGALGYLLKAQPQDVLIQQMRLLADGIPPLAPSVARRLVRFFAEQRTATMLPSPVQNVDQHDDLVQLSPRETEVLCLISKGMQIAEVAQLLNITANTVSSHIKNIYRKRNVQSRAEAALEAQRLGLV